MGRAQTYEGALTRTGTPPLEWGRNANACS